MTGVFNRLSSGKKQRAQGLFGAAGTPHIAIIGGGFGGIALAVRLRQAGITTFTVFEKNPSAGGTWWENRYPGGRGGFPIASLFSIVQAVQLVAKFCQRTRVAGVHAGDHRRA